ncbi:MAG: hypothetical protein WBJ35_09050 [Acetomicrobium sp.]|jgi:hypothetical protein|nr:hypothetical protein [Acetomicrobium sp.]HPT65171.1 hypothetical protein [Acetomicrobium sp.]
MAVVEIKIASSEVDLSILFDRTNKSKSGQEVITRKAKELHAVAERLVRPVLLYEICAPDFKKGALTLSVDDRAIAFGRHDGLSDFVTASEVFVGLVTLGRAIEEEIQRYNSMNEVFASYVLSEISVAMMGQVIKKVKNVILNVARQRYFGLSPVHIPGSTPGLPLLLQPLILELLGGKNHGVDANERHMLKPFYSVTFMVGMGPNYANDELFPKCSGCSRMDTCAWRSK